ncbi:hypothetical protein BKA56DRAFT_578299 [Ilyonectria sp. MPI-CAGE-AT-0026]|nr:hypothetical protein BKA56DRAFT_578299 [Ilyonectria sp. MPI-CAGE-AT-0026]
MRYLITPLTSAIPLNHSSDPLTSSISSCHQPRSNTPCHNPRSSPLPYRVSLASVNYSTSPA